MMKNGNFLDKQILMHNIYVKCRKSERERWLVVTRAEWMFTSSCWLHSLCHLLHSHTHTKHRAMSLAAY